MYHSLSTVVLATVTFALIWSCDAQTALKWGCDPSEGCIEVRRLASDESFLSLFAPLSIFSPSPFPLLLRRPLPSRDSPTWVRRVDLLQSLPPCAKLYLAIVLWPLFFLSSPCHITNADPPRLSRNHTGNVTACSHLDRARGVCTLQKPSVRRYPIKDLGVLQETRSPTSPSSSRRGVLVQTSCWCSLWRWSRRT